MLEKFEKLKDMKKCDLEQNKDLIRIFYDLKKKVDKIDKCIIDALMLDRSLPDNGLRWYRHCRNEFLEIAKEKEKVDKNFDFRKEEILYYLEGKAYII